MPFGIIRRTWADVRSGTQGPDRKFRFCFSTTLLPETMTASDHSRHVTIMQHVIRWARRSQQVPVGYHSTLCISRDISPHCNFIISAMTDLWSGTMAHITTLGVAVGRDERGSK